MENSSTLTRVDRVVEYNTEPTAGFSPRWPDDARWKAVVETVGRKRHFWIHCSGYLIINGLLLVIWQMLVRTPGVSFFWPILPLAGWGMGLAVHAFLTFSRASVPVTETEIRQVLQQGHRN